MSTLFFYHIIVFFATSGDKIMLVAVLVVAGLVGGSAGAGAWYAWGPGLLPEPEEIILPSPESNERPGMLV